MKIRNGFVSNSSSSSFMIYDGDIKEISMDMFDVIISNFEDYIYKSKKEEKKAKKVHTKWLINLKTALKRKDVLDGTIGITMPSCNYDTYLVLGNNNLYITTCNNYQWNLDCEINYEDRDEHEHIYGIVQRKYFYNICNKIIHSYEQYEDNHKSSCPKCKGYYGNYVLDKKGNRLCGSCFKGKLEPTDEMKLEKMKKNGVKNPITSLDLNE